MDRQSCTISHYKHRIFVLCTCRYNSVYLTTLDKLYSSTVLLKNKTKHKFAFANLAMKYQRPYLLWYY